MQGACGPVIRLGNEPQSHHPVSDDRLPETTRLFTSWVLIGVVDGVIEIRSGKSGTLLRAGQLTLLPPGRRRACRQRDAHYRFLIFDLVADSERSAVHPWSSEDTQVQPDDQALWGCTLGLTPPPTLARQAQETLRFCCDRWWRGLGPRLQAQAQLGLFIANWVSAQQGADSACEDDVQAVEQEARQRLPTGFDVSDMAAAYGMSRVLFTRHYQSLRGHGPGAFLRRLRLELACELMEEGGWSLDRIAKHVGYRSEVTFARAFKQRYGVAPRWWKRDASGLGDS